MAASLLQIECRGGLAMKIVEQLIEIGFEVTAHNVECSLWQAEVEGRDPRFKIHRMHLSHLLRSVAYSASRGGNRFEMSDLTELRDVVREAINQQEIEDRIEDQLMREVERE